MGTTIYGYLETGQNINIDLFWNGDYSSISDPTDLFDAFNLRTVTIISFMDIDTPASVSWVTNLKSIYSAIDNTKVLIIGVLYRDGNNTTPANCATALTGAGYGNYDIPGAQYIPFVLLNNGLWDGSSAAEIYNGGLGGTSTPPFTYIINTLNGTHTGADNAAILTDDIKSLTPGELLGLTINNITDGSSGTITANTANTVTATLSGGTDNDWDAGDEYRINRFRVTDKWHLGSTNNGNSEVGIADLIDLSTGSTYDISNLAHNELFVNRRIADLLTLPRVAAVASPDPSLVSDGSRIGLSFMGTPGSVVKKIIGAGDSGNYSPAGTIESVTGHAQVTLDSYLGSTNETCTISLQNLNSIGDGNPYNLSLESGLTDTAGNLITHTGGSYTIDLSLDTTPPKILSVKINPHLDK